MGENCIKPTVKQKLSRKTTLKISISFNHLRFGVFFCFLLWDLVANLLGLKMCRFCKSKLYFCQLHLQSVFRPWNDWDGLFEAGGLSIALLVVWSSMSWQLSRQGSRHQVGQAFPRGCCGGGCGYPVANNSPSLAGMIRALFWWVPHRDTTMGPQKWIHRGEM